MQGPEPATRPTTVRFKPGVEVGIARSRLTIASRLADAVWSAVHVLGAHRWREGYETDLERGWTRYRGSRCTICDSPWEGW